MRVGELINLLKKCDPEDIVICERQKDDDTVDIADVLIGHGTLKGFVYIKEDKMMMNDEREKKLREAAEKMKSACDAFYESDESCSACPAYIENKLTGETRCYFSDTWTEPHDWDV